MAPRSLKLLFDENFSHRHVEFVARESRLAEMQHVHNLRWSGEEDVVWIPRAVAAGFCIVTGDRNEKTRGFTVADLRAMGARVLLIGSFFDHLDRWGRAKWLVSRAETVVKAAEQLNSGSIVLLDRNGQGTAI